MPILSSFYDGVPGRQATLLKATGASRSSFAQSMTHLIDIGLIERNPGHGHPLRPEFRMTPSGKKAAEIANIIYACVGKDDHDLLRLSWSLPVLAALHSNSHFNEIKRSLPTITDRALSKSLQSLEQRGWIKRSVCEKSRPPRSLYSSINTGNVISRLIAEYVTL